MSNIETGELQRFSQSLVDLVSKTAASLLAVKAAPYRVVSGIAWGNDLVAVADHTLRREDRIPVQTAAGSAATGAILGRDPSVDLAFLRVEGLAMNAFKAADATTLKAGMLAAVVGLTIDAGPSASLGILGAVGPARRTWRGGTLDHFVRLDANVYPSQSGAAVVNAEGELIGLATQGLLKHSAVAVPVATIERVARELLEQGRIRHGYLGVGVQAVAIPPALRGKLAQPQEVGLILLTVESDSPAERAGLQIGDILLALGNRSVTELDELQNALRGDAVGSKLRALVLRGGEPLELEVAVSERNPQRNQRS